MKKWYHIAAPHEDIRRGNFDESVFAAKLGDVVDGAAPADYNDPYAFYKKTFLTAGLEKLLKKVHGKLAAGDGPGVINFRRLLEAERHTHSSLSIITSRTEDASKSCFPTR